MIELIFSIAIMGIALMSAPMLMATASKSGYVAIQQEAISEAASQLNIILGYQWDENNTNTSYINPILHVTAGDSELEANSTTQRRNGTPPYSSRTFVREDGSKDFNASLPASFGHGSGQDGGETERDDMDDFHGRTTTLQLVGSDTTVDYADQISINTNVAYLTDTAAYQGENITFAPNYSSTPSGSTNIKAITVTLTSTSDISELNKTIILRAFSCNIGGHKPKYQDF
jgi:hypothetical protein